MPMSKICWRTAVLIAIAGCLGLAPAPAPADCTPVELRCEYRVDPLGIDVAQPRLFWKLQSNERGQRQTAYRVLVASTPQQLAADDADLWDSGRVESDATTHVAYAGPPLLSRTRCYWKVRVWDRSGTPSAWSQPALWTIGLIRPDDWHAQWITDPQAAQRAAVVGHNGYHSALATTADAAKWVAIDLGQAKKIDAVTLYPARPFDWQEDVPGFLYPLRFTIAVAGQADFSDAQTVVDQTGADVPPPGMQPQTYRFTSADARYVRLTVPKLRMRDPGNYAVAVAEMQVLAGGQVVSQGAKVTALDSVEMSHWSTRNLTDGVLEPRKPSADRYPAVTVRKRFVLDGPVRRATVYVTARGLYELRLNGRRVGEQILAPEWTDYDRKIQVQTYDVTDLVRPGENALGAFLGDGWYSGRLGLAPPPGRHFYGTHPQLLAQLEVERADGPQQVIATDGTWRATEEGPIRYSDILDGEAYDATREMPGWDQPGFADAGWNAARVSPRDERQLVWQPNEPIRVVQELAPLKLTEPKPGVHVFDLGQNMVGWVRAKLRGPAGTEVTLQYAEQLNPDGTVYTANLRGAPQRDTVILKDGETHFEPHFTYHGFRYVQVTGLPATPRQDDVLGRVFHSAAPDVGRFECDNPLLNQLMQNIVWVQRGNLHSSPTDCPQRDERLGWMGDIQAFSQTAIFNLDMAGFFTKWVPDVREAQHADGRFPDFAPQPFAQRLDRFFGVPAWGDAGVVVPWRMWVNYADRRLLEQHFAAMVAWNEYVLANNPDLLWRKGRHNDYGDWLNGDTLQLDGYPHGGNEVPKDVFATMFWKRSSELIGRMAAVLGRDAEARQFAERAAQIRAAFNWAYVAADGKIQGHTQAGYALALRFDMLDEPQQAKALEYLRDTIRAYKGHPSTGIQTTHRMLLELSERGQHAEACRLVLLDDVPSWGYMIRMGATTIWERWDGYVEGRGFQNPGMNSFNHWAFGAVGEWIWRNVAGINPDEQQPGYQHVIIRPRPGPGYTRARGEYNSIRGPIISDWRIDAGRIALDVQIPPGSTATVYVPTTQPNAVTESGQPVADAESVEPAGAAAFRVGSGRYCFRAPYP